jgi:hypothetical protein
MAKRRSSKQVPSTAREVLGQALTEASPKLGQAYEIAQERVAAPVRAGMSVMSKKARVGVWVAGVLMSVGLLSAGVNHVARPAIASVAKATLGPGYKISCQLPSGNWGVCPGWRK